MNIKDIAALCGVSPSTVSKIINNKDQNISKQTREKVLQVIREYRFVPYAKFIKSNQTRSFLLGVIVCKQRHAASMLYSLGKYAKIAGYSLIFSGTETTAEEFEKQVEILKTKGVDGILSLFCPAEKKDYGIPMIYLQDSPGLETEKDFAVIGFDKKDFGYLATSELLSLGHRKIGALLCPEDERISAGMDKALNESDRNGLRKTVVCRPKEELLKVYLNQVLCSDCTAILCSDTEIARQIQIKTEKELTPMMRKISLITFTETPNNGFCSPPLTAVSVSEEDFAQAAVRNLILMIEEKKADYRCSQRFEPVFFERESVFAAADYHKSTRIVVVGSMNMDCMINVEQIPSNGDVATTRKITMFPGGKGANQAVAIGKLGGEVYMIGCLGNDGDGNVIFNSLKENGVYTDGVIFNSRKNTGKAYILVANQGESSIVIYGGANEMVKKEQVHQFAGLFENASYCLLTLEIPEKTVEYTINKCHNLGVKVILKPSPAESLNEKIYDKIDYFLPNEKELNRILPQPITLEEKAEILFQKGVKHIIITLGSRGCYIKTKDICGYLPATDFNVVDTTGAADAFIGAFTVALSEENDFLYALAFATYAAGISITRPGVQPALVDRSGIMLYQEEIRNLVRKFQPRKG